MKNLPKLRQIGFQANRRLLDVQRISHDCHLGEAAFQAVNRPVVRDGQRASALRTALFWTRSYARLLRPGMAQLDPEAFASTRLRHAFNTFNTTLENAIQDLKLAS